MLINQGKSGRMANFFTNFMDKLLGRNKKLKIGLYGHPNSGKTTLANRMCEDWLRKPLLNIRDTP